MIWCEESRFYIVWRESEGSGLGMKLVDELKGK